MQRQWNRLGLSLTAAVALLLMAGMPAVSQVPGLDGVSAWGENQFGEVGDGTTMSRLSPPVRVSGLGPGSGVIAVSAGAFFSLALKSDGSVLAWGANFQGQLGDGTMAQRSTPVVVSGLGPGSGVIAVSAGFTHSLALKSDGTVLAWGSGRLGDGALLAFTQTTPVQVSGLGPGSGVTAVSAGAGFSLALRSNGTVLAWGANQSGQLGDGTTTERPIPIQISSLSGVASISAGYDFTLATKLDGSALAWGFNREGQLGDGTGLTRPSPVQINGLTAGSNILSVHAGLRNSLAVKSDGSVLAWGINNEGQLGDGTTLTRLSPVQVSGLGAGSGVTTASAGGSHSLAVKSDGTVLAWGSRRRIGDATLGTRLTPGPVNGLGLASGVAASAGGSHSLAFQLGGGTTTTTTTSSTTTTTTLPAASPPCLDTDGVRGNDNDRDALCDNWEDEGIDFNGIRLKLAYDENQDGSITTTERSDKNRPDVFLEIDAMRGRAPSPAALSRVRDAFAQAPTPITLHILVDDTLGYANGISFGSCGPCPPSSVGFDDVKAVNFGSAAERQSPNSTKLLAAKRYAFHYSVWANGLGRDSDSSGLAEVGGNDFIITLGRWAVVNGTVDQQAGTLMHELGHNLGLTHGGSQAQGTVNCKPNYLSVMNYTRQTVGAVRFRRLDYSRQELPPLFENSLDERAGIRGPALVEVAHGPGVNRISPANGPIDWNGVRGIESVSVPADVNRIASSQCDGTGSALLGYNDWPNLDFNFRDSPDFADGVHTSASPIDDEVSYHVMAALSSDTDGDGVKDVDDICVFVSDPQQVDSDADGLGDACQLGLATGSGDPPSSRSVGGIALPRTGADLLRLLAAGLFAISLGGQCVFRFRRLSR